jgi:UPF0176 protein
MPITVAALYQFNRIDRPDLARDALLALAHDLGLKGSLIVASEGINGTLAGGSEQIAAFLDAVRQGSADVPAMQAMELKTAAADSVPFRRLKVKLKREIVTLGAPEADPAQRVGTYVAPEDWHDILDDPDCVLVDTRNAFEIAYGSFDGAIDPGTTKFSEFPAFVSARLDPAANRKVAMFCTGGIRCEKASSLLLSRGFETVYHLEGGILAYLAKVKPADRRWRGTCFVFDEREAVGHVEAAA